MLPRNIRQEQLSRAYVRAVAARAGVICATVETDFGFDVLLRGVRAEGGSYRDYGPQIDIQLKSTTQAEVREGEVAYDLEVRAYDLLRLARPIRPRLLILLLLPDDELMWLNQTEEELTLRRCAYWLSLGGAAESKAKNTVRVRIPRANGFTPEALRRLMEEAEREERP